MISGKATPRYSAVRVTVTDSCAVFRSMQEKGKIPTTLVQHSEGDPSFAKTFTPRKMKIESFGAPSQLHQRAPQLPERGRAPPAGSKPSTSNQERRARASGNKEKASATLGPRPEDSGKVSGAAL